MLNNFISKHQLSQMLITWREIGLCLEAEMNTTNKITPNPVIIPEVTTLNYPDSSIYLLLSLFMPLMYF